MRGLIPACLALLTGCGASFDWSPSFAPDDALLVSDALSPVDLVVEDAFYVTGTVDGQPMVGLLAASFPDACEAYSAFVPAAADAYDAMLNMDGGDAEFEVLQGWQDAMEQAFPYGSTVFFAAAGVAQLSTASVATSFSEDLPMASSTLDDTYAGQPAGTFVGGVAVLAEGMSAPCLYTGQCDSAVVDAAWDASYNLWGADQGGTLDITEYEGHGRLKGSGSVHLVNRWIKDDLGQPAALGDAQFSFNIKECDTLDERIFRYWTFI